ncbi:hypothetical protein MUCCIDRAFT_116100 [Mucor lusitanicus CBS 277.49]|uniref:Uncharacterized protein n=1 Tax=Mucor lusitanicus CBS 277.49 TaxID=747725 RepID=A0A168GTU9_MUCCL|nr:hypothetical protein MUCCIDRAFT_116100 [Mucor lusitanicus CBS 277.49]
MESWKWALIGVGIAVFVAINAIVIYCLYYRRNTEAINVLSKEEQEHPSVDSNTIIDEGVVATDPKNMTLQQQQQDYAVAVQTALSPPRPRHIVTTTTKENTLTTPTTHRILHEQQELRVFSLSPLHVQQPSSEARPSEKTNSICSTSTTTDRSMTPFQHTTSTPPAIIGSIWRGPTPPWTQHPNNRYRNSSVEMNKQRNLD